MLQCCRVYVQFLHLLQNSRMHSYIWECNINRFVYKRRSTATLLIQIEIQKGAKRKLSIKKKKNVFLLRCDYIVFYAFGLYYGEEEEDAKYGIHLHKTIKHVAAIATANGLFATALSTMYSLQLHSIKIAK